MLSVGCFNAIYLEKLLISKLHLIHWRNFPKVALVALPVEVAHEEPAFLPCLVASLGPSWHEQKSSSHHTVLQSIRKAAGGPFGSSLGSLYSKGDTLCPWVSVKLGEFGQLLFSRTEARSYCSGVAMPLWGWIFANFGGFGMTLFWNGKSCPDATIAVSDPGEFFLVSWFGYGNLLGFVSSEHPYVWEREILLISFH